MAGKHVSVIAKGAFCPLIQGGAYCVSFMQPGQDPQRVSGTYDQVFSDEKEVERVSLSDALVRAYRQNHRKVVIYSGRLDLVNRYRRPVKGDAFSVRYRHLSEDTAPQDLLDEHLWCTIEAERILEDMRLRNLSIDLSLVV